MFENNIQATSVEILNANENWTLNAEDSSLRNTFISKSNSQTTQFQKLE